MVGVADNGWRLITCAMKDVVCWWCFASLRKNTDSFQKCFLLYSMLSPGYNCKTILIQSNCYTVILAWNCLKHAFKAKKYLVFLFLPSKNDIIYRFSISVFFDELVKPGILSKSK